MAGLSPGAQAQSQQLQPLRPNTRQRIQKLSTIPAAFNTTQSFTLPQVGLLSRIFLYANLTISDAAASPSVTANTLGPFNILKRVTGSTNLGTATIFDTSGWGMYCINKVMLTDVETRLANSDVTSDTFYNYPTSGFVQNTPKAVQFVLLIPVSANDGPQFDVGLINLQAPEIRFTLQITFGQASDAYTTSDTLTLAGNVYPYYEYYEVPDPSQVQLPQRILHRILEDQTAYASTGDITYLIPRQGVLLQMLHYVVLNGVRDQATSNVTGRRLVFNKTDTPYNIDYIVDRIRARFNYGHLELPGGVYLWDLWFSDETPSRGDLRDAIDTEALSTLESIITIASGASLGSGNNFVNNVRRITQQY